MKTHVTEVDIDIATGEVIDGFNPASPSAIVFRIALTGNAFERADSLRKVLLLPKVDKSTFARLYGTELPWPKYIRQG